MKTGGQGLDGTNTHPTEVLQDSNYVLQLFVCFEIIMPEYIFQSQLLRWGTINKE